MAELYFKVQGSNDETPNVGVVTADSKSEARRKLATTYGESIEPEFIDEDEFRRLEQEKGAELTHKVK
jgi:hypothetical protein